MQLKRLAGAALFALVPCIMAPSAPYAAVTEADFTAKTAGDLVDLCAADPKEPMGTAALNFCHGFAQGSVSVVMEEAAASKRAKLFCFPTPAPSRTATIADFVTWARANPGHLAETPADALFGFLRERFPCGKK